MLHQMFRVCGEEWRSADSGSRDWALKELAEWLDRTPDSAAYGMLGHKGDLLLLHLRGDFGGLLEAQTQVRKLRLSGYLEPTTSYLSVVELGLYESTRKAHDELSGKGMQPGTDEWEAGIQEILERQKKAMAPRLWPQIPPSKYLCFYPMDRKRGERRNWYTLPFADRQRMMHEHGMVGRKYGDHVKQIISGSIGFDDWEWGVDLFAEDPLWFKRLIYEMRFDEVSAVYALFGSFYIGQRLDAAGLRQVFG